MTVTTSAEYALYVDGVAWTPTLSTEESDEYIITSGGRFVFYDQRGRVIFSFYNQYTQDFQFRGQVRLYQLNNQGNSIGVSTADRKYVQVRTYYDGAVALRSYLAGNYTNTPAAECEPSTNNGEVGDMEIDNEHISFIVSNFDKTKPVIIKLGNVLTAYVVGQN